MKKIITLAYFWVALTVGFTTSSCAWWNSTGKKAVTDFIDCEVGSVKAKTPGLKVEVAKVLAQAPATWDAGMESLAGWGLDAPGCAVDVVLNDLLQKADAAAAEGKMLASVWHAKKAAYLKNYLSKKGYHFKRPGG